MAQSLESIRSRIEALGMGFQFVKPIRTTANGEEGETWLLEYEDSQFVFVPGQKNVTLGWDTEKCPFSKGLLEGLREEFTLGHEHYEDEMKEMKADCDKDTILAKVAQVGAACHTGNHSCFFNEIMKKEYDETNPLTVFESVSGVIKDRKVHPKEGSYTNYRFDKGIDKILKKLGEEATEIVIAAKNPNANEIKYEIADFLYHMMVLMVEKGVSWEEITEELAKR